MFERSVRPNNQATLCFIIESERILLAMKKRGFGVGKYNGYGGKVKEGESIEKAAVREFMEESCLSTSESDLRKVGEIDFYFPHRPEFDQTVHVFIVERYSGRPKETDEMAFRWFPVKYIPYGQMWDDDKYWMPIILSGKKINASFEFRDENGENIVDKKQIISK